MSFGLTGRRGEASTGRKMTLGPQMLVPLRTIDVALTPTSREEPEPADILSPEQVSRLRCEGRIAAFQGLSPRACPYMVSSPKQREAWLEGYNTLK
jgi:ribosome modulation factor